MFQFIFAVCVQVVKSLLLDVCSEVIQEARDVKSAEDQAERMRIRNKLAAEHISGLIDRLVNQEARNICDSVFRFVTRLSGFIITCKVF